MLRVAQEVARVHRRQRVRQPVLGLLPQSLHRRGCPGHEVVGFRTSARPDQPVPGLRVLQPEGADEPTVRPGLLGQPLENHLRDRVLPSDVTRSRLRRLQFPDPAQHVRGRLAGTRAWHSSHCGGGSPEVRVNSRAPRGDVWVWPRQVQASRSSNQVTVRPPRRCHPHRAARRATNTSPRPPSTLQATERACGTPGPLRSMTSTRTTPSPDLTATVTASPAAPTGCAGRCYRTTRLPATRRHTRVGARNRAQRVRTRGRPEPVRAAQPPPRSP